MSKTRSCPRTPCPDRAILLFTQATPAAMGSSIRVWSSTGRPADRATSRSRLLWSPVHMAGQPRRTTPGSRSRSSFARAASSRSSSRIPSSTDTVTPSMTTCVRPFVMARLIDRLSRSTGRSVAASATTRSPSSPTPMTDGSQEVPRDPTGNTSGSRPRRPSATSVVDVPKSTPTAWDSNGMLAPSSFQSRAGSGVLGGAADAVAGGVVEVAVVASRAAGAGRLNHGTYDHSPAGTTCALSSTTVSLPSRHVYPGRTTVTCDSGEMVWPIGS